MSLRDEIYKHQHVGPLGEAHAAFYRAQRVLLDMAGVYSRNDLPLISLAVDESRWRGKYESVGPFGLEHVITINATQFETGMDAAPTLAHELAHWLISPHKGHDVEFYGALHRFGLNEQGQALPEWWDYWEHLEETGLPDVYFRDH